VEGRLLFIGPLKDSSKVGGKKGGGDGTFAKLGDSLDLVAFEGNPPLIKFKDVGKGTETFLGGFLLPQTSTACCYFR